ncbi:hypothetical protein NLG97_g4324 [Lecanicillium saksenae]|uniref:Uncharacterized protein n=1 Tax=Lecanicillium saksenae TaxID=468837 RepID=A0ACC1QVS5_9HYPO|nr:hypothetical protein NLG97_g4324 [Lecanicillium saksenae]
MPSNSIVFSFALVFAMDFPLNDRMSDVKMGQSAEHRNNVFALRKSVPSSNVCQDASQLARSLVRTDAAKFFAENLEDMLHFWTALLDGTSLPRNISYTDPRIANAFRSLDKFISRPDSTPLALRLAYTRMPMLMDAVKGIIATNKRQGRLRVPISKLNSNIALELYAKAQGKEESCHTRRQLDRRRRLAQRWVDISGTHPLALVTYTEEAEKLITNFALPNRVLRVVAAETIRLLPAQLVQASAYLSQITQTSAKPADCLAVVREMLSDVDG